MSEDQSELTALYYDTALRITQMSDRGEISITAMIKVLREYDEARQAVSEVAND